MAIDPKLVSIKQASDLPSAIPTNAGEFLFFEDNTLQKSPMSDIYDRVASGIKGVATTSTVPSATGFERWLVHEAGTYTNFSGIVVTAADLDVVNGVANNRVILEVSEGVATKRIERVKGDKSEPLFNSATDLAQIIDSQDNIAAVIDESGDFKNAHYPLGMAKEIKEQIINEDNPDLIRWTDSADNLLLRMDSKGDLFIPNLVNTPIQKRSEQQLGNIENDSRYIFKSEVLPYLSMLQYAANGHAPAPFGLMPQNYTVSNTIVNDLTIETPPGRLSIDTPYGNDDFVVHPHVIQFYGKFRGYKYWMCITPYQNGNHENPVIYGSNDLIDWEMLDGFSQPIANPITVNGVEGYLSDNFWVYNHFNGELICAWRRMLMVGGSETYLLEYKSTKDGYTWSEQNNLPLNGNEQMASPSILYNFTTKKWMAWYVLNDSRIGMKTADNFDGPWSAETEIPFYETGVWHMEVRYVGDKFVMLINKRDPDAKFYLAISDDGITWTQGTYALYSGGALYKASLLPVISDTTIKMDIIWTTNHDADAEYRRRLFKSTTNSITI